MNKLKMTIVMMIGIFFMVGMLGTACAQGSNFSVNMICSLGTVWPREM